MAARPTCARLALLALLAAACATLDGPQEETPPDVPTPRYLRSLSPNLRDKVFPTAAVFSAREWLERLVCPVGDLPGWKQTGRQGGTFVVEVECPGAAPIPVRLDTSGPEPSAPQPLRQLAREGLAKYREAVSFEEKRAFAKALEALDEAVRLSPEEVAYRRERIYVLYALDRIPEAIVGADDLVETDPSPLAWKYRALAAKALRLEQETLRSLEEILVRCDERHPLFAEAMCAKGMILTESDADEGELWMRQSCAMKHEPCCSAMSARDEARQQARRAIEATRALPLKVPPIPAPKADEPGEADVKRDSIVP